MKHKRQIAWREPLRRFLIENYDTHTAPELVAKLKKEHDVTVTVSAVRQKCSALGLKRRK